MGIYLNPGKASFQRALNSEFFIDKTPMISYLNSIVNTDRMYVSVSRPRRFGKTMAINIVSAYYDREADSRALFEGSRLSGAEDLGKSDSSDLPWDTYLGKFDVIRLVMTKFFNGERTIDNTIGTIKMRIMEELSELYPGVSYDEKDFFYSMEKFYRKSGVQFVIVIDEWDAIFREYKDDKEGQKKYLDFLRDWLKDNDYIALAYITGILPIKKYGKHSALNMFWEYSMTQPMQLAEYVGFTEEEVKEECRRRCMNFEGFRDWYDGYRLSNEVSGDAVSDTARIDKDTYREYEIYSPFSVVRAMISKQFDNYWNQTETFEALKQYIEWDFDGLKEDVAILMGGGRVPVDITGYQNDMTTFYGKDDILTMLIHLGYLGYNRTTKEVFIPNKEVRQVFVISTKSREWAVTFRALENSKKLLEATWAGNESLVAKLIEAAYDKAGNRTYHSEIGLSYAVQLAYYSAQDLYTIIPELDTGKGYADLSYIPKTPDVPAMLIELKYEKDFDTAIDQIHRQRYPDRLSHYKGNLILVGINYDREIKNDSPQFKHHSCKIERE